jgi:Obg family GTPase CgtA
MALPHRVQMELIRKRLKNKEGRIKLNEIDKVMQELPGYNTGPYGEIKKWLRQEARKTKTRSKIKYQDWMGVKKQGLRQFVLVGLPNAGKSSLLNKLSGAKTKVAGYSFTTLKPFPVVVKINNAEIQIVDLPGLIEGASENIGHGKRFLGIIKSSNGLLLMHDLSKPANDLEIITNELKKGKIKKPAIIIGSKSDLPEAGKNLKELRKRFRKIIPISNTTGQGIDKLKNAIWNKSGLMRVYSKIESKPMIINKGSSVEDFARKIHRTTKVKFAEVSGKSVKFPNQRVGLKHVLEDGDRVKLVFER